MGHPLRLLTHRVADAFASLRGRLAALSGVDAGPGARIGPACEIALGPSPSRRGRIVLGERARIGRGVLLHPYGGAIVLGRNVFVGPYAVIYGHGGVEIGDQTLISMHCCIVSSNHAVPPPGVDIRSQPDVLRPTRIGRDVWLGAGSIVLGGATIGDGCVIGAGAVVSGVLPPNSIALGVPARVVRQRT